MCCGAKKRNIQIDPSPRALKPIRIPKAVVKPQIIIQRPNLKSVARVCKKCTVMMQRFAQKDDHNRIVTIWQCPSCKSVEKT